MKHGILLSLLLCLTSCAHWRAPKPKPVTSDQASQSLPPPGADRASSVEITYVLGHDHHQLKLDARPDSVQAKSSLDRKTLITAEVDREQYLAFLKGAAELIDSSRRPASNSAESSAPGNAPCRSPYTVTVRWLEHSRTLSGCRSGEEGSRISQLTRDAEFLLYSKN